MTTIRDILLGLTWTMLLGFDLAVAQSADEAAKVIVSNRPIGIVAFDGPDGQRLTDVLRDKLVDRFSIDAGRDIQLIDRLTFNEAVIKSGPDEKAAREIGARLGLESVTFGTAILTITDKPKTQEIQYCVEPDGATQCKKFEARRRFCLETEAVLRVSVATVQTKANDPQNVELIEHSDRYLTCDGQVVRQTESANRIIGRLARSVENGLAASAVNSTMALTERLFDHGVGILLSRISKYIRDVEGERAFRFSRKQTNVSTSVNIGGNTTINAASVKDVTVNGSTILSNGVVNIGSISIPDIKVNERFNAAVDVSRSNDRKSGISFGFAVGKKQQGSEAMSEPPFFPWPPPRPSLLGEVTSNFVIAADFAFINRQINALLVKKTYDSLRYFGIDGGNKGFVVTTDLERVSLDGKHAAKDRWLIGKSGRASSFAEYIRNLIFGEKGRFRMFAFVVYNGEPGALPFPASQQDTERWKTMGALAMTARTGAIEVDQRTRVWLYVYEFESSLNKSDTIVALADNAITLAAHKQSLGLK